MCAGRLIAACGKNEFPQGTIEVFTTFAMQMLAQDNTKDELRETALSYFGDLAVLMKEEIQPVIDQVLNEIIKTIKNENDFKEVKKEKGFSLDSDSEELAGVDLDFAVLDEKSSAVASLGLICMNAHKACRHRMQEIHDTLESV